MGAPDFWNDQERAREGVAELKALKSLLKPIAEALTASEDLAAMVEMAAEDEEFAAEVPAELDRMEGLLEALELKALGFVKISARPRHRAQNELVRED